MPKKRSAKDKARLYTAAQRTRLQPPVQPDGLIKDVTTQLHELRVEQARERQLSTPQTTMASSLGFTPADYETGCLSTNSSASASQPRRRTPGSARPRSWLESPRSRLRRASIPMIVRSRTDTVPPFPDLDTAPPRSLVHHSLLTLGSHYYDHQEFNKYYLPRLPIHLKQWLLTYIAAKNIGGAITREGMDVLFPRVVDEDYFEEMEYVVACSRKAEVDLRYLDLADSLGPNFSISQLRSFLSPTDESYVSADPDSWYIPQAPRFPKLTHLSLDISPAHAPRFDRLKLATILSQNCTRLTHLSLAGVFDSSASASAIIHLSKNLVCLEYIDLSRTPALHERYGIPVLAEWEDDDTRPLEPYDFDAKENRLVDRLSWDGAWRNLRVLIVKKCGFTKVSERELRDRILEKRGGKGWIQVVTV